MKYLLVAVAIVLIAGCSGPQRPLDVGVQDFASSVQFGAPPAIAAPPLPPVAMTIPPPVATPAPIAGIAPVVPSPAAPLTTAPPPAPPCPPVSPFAVAALPSVNTIPKPPVPATYVYRDTGAYQTSGANPQKGNYPTSQTRTVSNVSSTTTGGFGYSVAAKLGDTVTTTSYGYIPPTEASQTAAGSTPTAGLYITKVVTKVGSGSPSTFAPAPPGLLLLEAPAGAGDTWNAAGTDPTTGTTMAFTATEATADKTVNACGQALDTIPVHLDGNIDVREAVAGAAPTSIAPGVNPGGQQVGPTTQTTFTADYFIVNQYGGLSVMDSVETTGTDQGVGVDRTLTSTINELPRQP